MDLAQRVAARYKRKKEVPSEDGGTTTVYEYSERQVAHRNAEKAKRLEKLKANIGKLREQVSKDLKSKDPEKQLTALVVGLIDETYERVGNDESAKDGHFGVTGWTKSHIKMSDGKATITYVGKSGVKQKKTVTSKPVLKALRDAFERCEGEDCLFEYDDGKVDATKVNAYLKKFDVTAKDLRGFHANQEMRKALKAERKGELPDDPKKRKEKLKKEWKKALEAAAAAVGHEPSTLKSQYLVPGLEDSYLKDGTVMDKLDKKATDRTLAAKVASRFVLAKADLSDKDKKRVIDLLAEGKGKPIPDKKIHDLADDLGISPHDLESYIYSFASLWAVNETAKVNPGGRAEAKGVTEKDFDPKTIQQGIKVELEHTKDRELAKKIVLDHLAESPQYYEALAKMESGLESGKKEASRTRWERLLDG